MEDEDFAYGLGENATLMQGDANANSSVGQFDSRVFWGVNCFIILLLSAMCIWCFWFGGKDRIVEYSIRRVDTDRQYQQTIRERHEERMAARRSTPAKRTARLKRSFLQNKVQMVSVVNVNEWCCLLV